MNNPIQFQTIADKIDIPIDTSYLYLQLSFSAVPTQTAKEAAVHYCKFINNFFNDEFITIWKCGSRKKLFSPSTEELSKYVPYLELEDAYFRTKSMFARKHIHALNRRFLYDQSLPYPMCSTDYIPYFTESILPVLSNDEALRQAMITLFSEKAKRPLAPIRDADARGMFLTFPEDDFSFCHGTVKFSIHTGCLGEDLSIAAELFAEELKALCVMLNFAGGSVGVNTIIPLNPSPHFAYFRNADKSELDHDCPDYCWIKDWNRVAFACDCAWGNVLSPIARNKLFPKDIPTVPESGLIIKELTNHGIYVQIDKEPGSVDVDDLLLVKKFLYPALYPGKIICWEFVDCEGKLRIHDLPRSWWERVPVFPEEITVQNSKLSFEYKKGLFGSGSQ